MSLASFHGFFMRLQIYLLSLYTFENSFLNNFGAERTEWKGYIFMSLIGEPPFIGFLFGKD